MRVEVIYKWRDEEGDNAEIRAYLDEDPPTVDIDTGDDEWGTTSVTSAQARGIAAALIRAADMIDGVVGDSGVYAVCNTGISEDVTHPSTPR